MVNLSTEEFNTILVNSSTWSDWSTEELIFKTKLKLKIWFPGPPISKVDWVGVGNGPAVNTVGCCYTKSGKLNKSIITHVSLEKKQTSETLYVLYPRLL